MSAWALASDPPALHGPPGGVAELAKLVRHAAATGAVREVLLLRRSRLAAGPDRAVRRRLLAEALTPLREATRLRSFDLPNRDLVLVATPPARDLAIARASLSALLEPAELARVLLGFHLPEEAAALLAAAEDSLELPPASGPGGAPGAPLDAAGLALLEQALAQADLTPFLRRQAVCRLTADAAAPQQAWEDWRVDPAAIVARLLPGTDLAAAPALAARLRRLIDRRLLADLARPAAAVRLRSMSLPLALASLTCGSFLQLDAALPASLRPALMVCLDPAEIIAAPEEFVFANAFLRLRGYRVCLDAPVPAMLALLPPERLGVDCVRLPFSRTLPADAVPLTKAIAAGSTVVLADADRPAAIAWAWQCGIQLFQGRMIERSRG